MIKILGRPELKFALCQEIKNPQMAVTNFGIATLVDTCLLTIKFILPHIETNRRPNILVC